MKRKLRIPGIQVVCRYSEEPTDPKVLKEIYKLRYAECNNRITTFPLEMMVENVKEFLSDPENVYGKANLDWRENTKDDFDLDMDDLLIE